MGRVIAARKSALAVVLACLSLPSQAAQDVNGSPVVKVGQGVPVDVPSTYYTQLHSCPLSCEAGSGPQDWVVYPSIDRLNLCNQPMLVDFAVFNPLDDPTTGVLLRACSLASINGSVAQQPSTAEAAAATPTTSSVLPRDDVPSSHCANVGTSSQADFAFVRQGSSTSVGAQAGILAILEGLQDRFQHPASCDTTSIFGYANGASVGLHVANAFGKSTIVSLLDSLVSEIKQNGISESMAAQLCSSGSGSNATTQTGVVGVSVDATGLTSLAAVQRDVASWAQGACSDSSTGAESVLAGVTVWQNAPISGLNSTISSNSTIGGNSTYNGTEHYFRGRSEHELQRRADCTTATVASGDSCGSMATKCGITDANFIKYNPATNLCSTLQPNQKVCCSAGTIPTPKENSNGTCFTYLIQGGDTCSAIALSNGLTVTQLENFNKGKTWAWTNCTTIQAGINICLSDGTAPLPAPYANAVCGPIMPNTTYPTDGTNITDLNPCPLNACCDIWGQCGITPEFCTVYKSPTGNPGYSPPGLSGCINNCGTNITNTGTAPASFGRVGYWESWNLDRPCLNLNVKHANTDGSYTRIHWAFGTLDSSFKPQINDTYKQWGDFLAMTGVKRVVSFGGWGYSTDPATYDVLRQAMAPANRDAFVTNIVNFLNTNKLDGVDFDWEYPGAPDIPGIPPGQVDDGPNYLKFLTSLRAKIPSGMSISIAAPASYWYLKAFPIAKMASALDYIVFMTYDLHGQWDYGNQFSVDGCPTGNCLRSHVNLTETVQVLAMITKAGVSTSKIYVGESSYGRSFGMSDPKCTGPMCTFTGGYDASTAQPGECTQTAGYISNAEIYTLLKLSNGTSKTWYDTDSNSDIMTWDNGQWVAFMSDNTRTSRRSYWQGFNFAGTIDWAVDLQHWTNDVPPGDDDDDDEMPPGDLGWGPCNAAVYPSLEALDADSGIPFYCAPLYLLQFLQANLTASMKAYDDLIKNGYDGKFSTYADAVVSGSGKEVDNFMRDNGNKYFTCVVTETTLCCDKCKQQAPGFPGACTYCFSGGNCCGGLSKRDRTLEIESGRVEERDRPQPAQNGCGFNSINEIYKNVTEPCPPDYSKRGLGQGYPLADTVYWTLPPDKHDPFFADLYNQTGISEDNISFQDINHSECDPGQSQSDCRNTNWDIGIPAPHGFTKDDVLNPKDTVSKAYNNLENIKGTDFSSVITQVANGEYWGDPLDLVDALTMPIFMISDAIDGMNSVVKVADEIDHEKMMAIIFGFLSAIFFFIPIAGEIAGEITALAGIARIAGLIGAAGNAAMDIYTLVDTKGNAPLAIFDLITAPLALLDIAAIAKAAGIRRGMTDDEIEGLGSVKPKLDIVDRVKTKGLCTLGKRDINVAGLEGPEPMSRPRNDAMRVSDLGGRGVEHFGAL